MMNISQDTTIVYLLIATERSQWHRSTKTRPLN